MAGGWGGAKGRKSGKGDIGRKSVTGVGGESHRPEVSGGGGAAIGRKSGTGKGGRHGMVVRGG